MRATPPSSLPYSQRHLLDPECPPLFSRSLPTFLEPMSPPPLSLPSDRDRRMTIFQFLELMKPGNTVVLQNAKIDMFKKTKSHKDLRGSIKMIYVHGGLGLFSLSQ
ncbi:hypothetical protein ACS0TY_032878 [Phlomoides rotata]